MAAVAMPFQTKQSSLDLPVSYHELCWYAAYTCANHEKRIAAQLGQRDIEHFLPMYEAVHRWKDRRMRLQLPLFPSYIFVHLLLRDRLRVLQVPGVVRLVGFGEHPTVLPREEIEMLRNGFRGELNAQPHPYLTKGRRVRIISGPLTGLEGILLRKKSNFRLIVSIDLIMRSIVVDVDAADIRPLNVLKLSRIDDSVELRSAREAMR